ncbi:MAG: ABC transporter permease subunit [Phycisphaerales bacterium]|nr:MAG: ABC transporter permease subunit [Phycisphaerales bacterium]
MAAMALVIVLGVALAWGLGPALERALFGGDMRLWLDGQRGTAWPGWWVLLALPMIVAVWYGMHRHEMQRRRSGRAGTTPSTAARELVRFLAVVGAGLVSAFGVAYVLQVLGLDPRESILGTFTQRNTLVVGVIMGFAVVPIIYTISEDSLRSVPSQLRTASLGAGATPWQTAVRVILPAAGSGVFSACMIGLGRAVGETMIVLMATGNTPEMSMNIFSGLRTLAANIAVELPEAPPGSTHYRVLVACGLVLFAMTFIINTSAEVVRQRVRKRLAAL